jgi:hypothetical protein
MIFKRKALAIAVMVATSTLTACGSSSDSEPENTAPTAIALSANTVDENTKAVEIGTLTATDADSGNTFTFTTDNTDFVITGDKLSLAAETVFDYEANAEVMVSVTVTDNGGLTHTQELTVTVNDLLDYYDFASKVGDTANSSVSYSGQIARHALIAELKYYIGAKVDSGAGLQFDLESGDLTSKEAIITKLHTYFDGQSTDWEDGAFPITFIDAKQATFSDISSSLKTLKGKVAGNDASGQHKLWNDDAFAGWGAPGSITPTALIESFFDQLADNAMENPGGKRYVPGAEQVEANEIPVYVNYNGTDLNQLIQKFLLMSITYSQATDDYLDENKGLATDNIAGDKDGTKDYTKLEHQFDEGFGYFGAARDYLAYNDNEIAGKVKTEEDGRADWNGMHDTNGDGEIDLLSEKMFGNSVNAAKRDRGSKDNAAATNYTEDAMGAFLAGRNLINANTGTDLTDDQMTELLDYRDIAVGAWEKAIAATVIHYINELHDDLSLFGTDDFSFTDAAKHFSELKGFALGLQFNPYSPITDTQFKEFHILIQDAPVLSSAAEVTAYQTALISASDILETALSFGAENVAGW